MKAFTIVFISIALFGCRDRDLIDILTTSEKWYDTYGNIYCFQNGEIRLSKVNGSCQGMNLGSFWAYGHSIRIRCSDGLGEPPFSVHLVDYTEPKLTLESSRRICDWVDTTQQFALWNTRAPLIDHGEELKFLVISANRSYNSIRRFEMNDDKTVILTLQNDSTSSFVLSDSIYNRASELVKVLPLEEYDSIYVELGFDITEIQFVITTNRISRTVRCIGTLPHGLDNLFFSIMPE